MRQTRWYNGAMAKTKTVLTARGGTVLQGREFYETVLRNIGEGVVVADKVMQALAVSDAACEAVGWSEQDLLGKGWLEHVQIEYEDGTPVPQADLAIARALSSGKKIRSQNYYYVRRDGSRFPVSVTATPLPNVDASGADDAARVIVVFSDITAQKEISHAKSEFIATASHQLRTPIASMNLQLEVFLRSARELKPEHREDLEEIYETQQALMNLVNRLLQTSRLELGRFAIAPEPTDLRGCIEEAFVRVSPLAEERHVKLTKRLEGKAVTVRVDRKLMEIILDNLLTNAIKYSPEKSGVVEINIEEANARQLRAGQRVPGEGVLISIRDNGMGIPEAEQQRVFRRLFRSSLAHQSDSGGSGLGLYMVRSILDYSGGNIWFLSKEGKGTTFVVWLPKEGMRTRMGNTEL